MPCKANYVPLRRAVFTQYCACRIAMSKSASHSIMTSLGTSFSFSGFFVSVQMVSNGVGCYIHKLHGS
jgi:hypothetical protein